MTASFTMNQAGLAAPGVADQSRDDGLVAGGLVTLTINGSPGTAVFELLWVGIHGTPDTTSVASLTPTGINTWTYSPTPGALGTWSIRLTTDAGTDQEDSLVLGFAVKTVPTDIRIPAPQERGLDTATLANVPANAVRKSWFNKPEGSGPFVGGTWAPWWRALADLAHKFNQGSFISALFGTPLDAGPANSGDYPRTSPAAGLEAAGTVTFPAVSGTIPIGTRMRWLAAADQQLLWYVTAIGSISGGGIIATVRGPGKSANVAAGQTMRLWDPPQVANVQATFPGATVDVVSSFAVVSGSTVVPNGTLIKLTSGGPASWSVSSSINDGSGFITLYLSGPVLDTGTSVDLNTPIAGVTTTGVITTKVAAASIVKLTGIPDLQWTVNADASVVGGVAVATMTGPGASLGAGVAISNNSSFLAGTISTASGINPTGTVGVAGITGGVDEFVPTPITQVFTGRRLNLLRFPNGDSRTADPRNGLFPNSTTPSRAGIQSIVNTMQPNDELDLGDVTWTLDATRLEFNRDAYPGLIGLKVYGHNTANQPGLSTLISYVNAPTEPMIVCGGSRIEFSRFRLQIQAGARWNHFEMWSRAGTNWIKLDMVLTVQLAGTTTNNHIGLGTWKAANGNLENCSINRCAMSGIGAYGLVMGSGQPYTLNCYDTSFFGLGGGALRGVGYRANLYSGNLLLVGCDFQNLEAWGDGGDSNTVNISPQSENCKKLVVYISPASAQHIIENGRIGAASFGAVSVNYPASDGDFIDINGAGLTLDTTRITNFNEMPGQRIALSGTAALTLVGQCILPSREAFYQKLGNGAQVTISESSGYISLGSVNRFENYPQGGLNGPGRAVLYGGQTEVEVPLYCAEPTTDYYPTVLSVEGVAGAPAAASKRFSVKQGSKTINKFTLQAEGSPGATTDGVAVVYGFVKAPPPMQASALPGYFCHWRSRSNVTHSNVAGTERATSWADLVSGLVVNNGTPANGLIYDPADVLVGGRATLTVDNGLSLVSTLTAANWAWMHDGPMTFVAVTYSAADVSSAQLGTSTTNNAALYGFNFYTPATATPQLSLFNGSGLGISISGASGQPNKARWHVVAQTASTIRMTTSVMRNWTTRDGQTVARGTPGTAPQATFGIRGTSATQWKILEIIGCKSTVSRGDWERFLAGYLTPEWGGII